MPLGMRRVFDIAEPLSIFHDIVVNNIVTVITMLLIPLGMRPVFYGIMGGNMFHVVVIVIVAVATMSSMPRRMELKNPA